MRRRSSLDDTFEETIKQFNKNHAANRKRLSRSSAGKVFIIFFSPKNSTIL